MIEHYFVRLYYLHSFILGVNENIFIVLLHFDLKLRFCSFTRR